MPDANPLLDDLAELERLAKEATPGPRRIVKMRKIGRRIEIQREEHEQTIAAVQGVGAIVVDTPGGIVPSADANLIAACDPARLLRIVAAVRELERDRERLTAALRIGLGQPFSSWLVHTREELDTLLAHHDAAQTAAIDAARRADRER